MTKAKAPDIDALFADLGATHPGRGRYEPMDRYRDFRALFLGSEQGKRVLFEILSWGHMFAPSAVMGQFDPHKTFFADGERNISLRVFNTVHSEPKPPPGRQVSTDPEAD